MPIKPTLFCVTDIETTYRHRVAFDVAWKIVDRKRREYGKGSYIITEAFSMDVPFFKEKLGYYFLDTYSHLIQPLELKEIKTRFNNQIRDLRNLGHTVVFCAYNALFDATHLGQTTQKFLNEKFLDHKIPLLDIWDFWCRSAPRHYNYATPKGNPKTSAEYVYRFESGDTEFNERHIAFSDVEIESDILVKTLARKKEMPLVMSPVDFTGSPWRKLLNYPNFVNKENLIIVEDPHKKDDVKMDDNRTLGDV